MAWSSFAKPKGFWKGLHDDPLSRIHHGHGADLWGTWVAVDGDAMRNLNLLDIWRVTDPKRLAWTKGWASDDTCGVFEVPSSIDRAFLRIIASNGEGWDHVSVSRANHCPNWTEMSHIAQLFFKDDETAMQLHVPRSEHLNLHPHCLHWWRPHDGSIPKPPSYFVAVPGSLEDNKRYMESLSP